MKQRARQVSDDHALWQVGDDHALWHLEKALSFEQRAKRRGGLDF